MIPCPKCDEMFDCLEEQWDHIFFVMLQRDLLSATR